MHLAYKRRPQVPYFFLVAVHLCPILTGLFICVLFSQGSKSVSYSHRALHLCPILTGLKKCVLFSQGCSTRLSNSTWLFVGRTAMSTSRTPRAKPLRARAEAANR